MPVCTARKAALLPKPSRAWRRSGLAVLILVLSCDALQDAIADGDTRTVAMHHLHTGEDISITYKRNGRYDDQALGKLNWFLRDWRREQQIKMDPRLIDLVWEVQRDVGAKAPIQIICGYRAPETNAMLRRRSGGVARTSQHMAGNAMDFSIPDASIEDLRVAGLRLQRGGVGYYPTSGSPFVHLDTGSVRHWPRMTHDQLARVFPDGRTVHIPSDGNPLPGYALALADIEKRGGSPSAASLDAARSNGVDIGAKKSFLAKLFGFDKNKGDEEVEPETPAASAKVAERKVADATPAKPRQLGAWKRVPGLAAEEPAAAPEPVKSQPVVAAVPMPKDRPSSYQLAAALIPPPEKPARPAQSASLVANTPNDIIVARGFWTGLPVADNAGTDASASRRRPVETASADTTASIGPFPAPEREDRVKPDTALAYAAPIGAEPASRTAKPVSATIPRPTAAATSVALKRESAPTNVSQSLGEIAAALPPAPARPGQRYDDPWTRATAMTPSIERFMNTTLFGMPDFRNLQPLLARPSSSVVMTFSADPHLGMTATAFSGPAVVFVATMSFSSQSAALR